MLWAAAVYWTIAALLARVRPLHLALLAAIVATGVEFFKRVQTPGLNAFRDSLAGKVLLGRYFSYTDIAMYLVAIGCAAWMDQNLVGRAASKASGD